MRVRVSTLDDLLNQTYARLLRSGRPIHPTKGPALEIAGALLELRNPRARLSRTESRSVFFSCLGESLWYLAGSDRLAFIRHYNPDYPSDSPNSPKVRAAYGPRLRPKRGVDQLERVIALLKAKPDSRRAVIPIFEPQDTLGDLPEVPCTCALQFLVRNGRLEALTYMRSNDAFVGLPADVFAFTFLQEIVARALSIEVGTYKHLVGSLHIYDSDRPRVERYLREGWQMKHAMPPLPLGDPFPMLKKLLALESAVRGGRPMPRYDQWPEYWQDIARLLRIYAASAQGKRYEVRAVKRTMASDSYNIYIENRWRRADRIARENNVIEQQNLFDF